jgi:hypothetical protein
MRAGVDQGGIIYPVLLSLYVNDMHTPSRHIELVLYTDDTIIIATYRSQRCSSTAWRHLSDLEW